ncbi:MAG TPA: hypothetical protein VNG29_02005 [Candidatus Paceibacterota bacterium]|nr:hypothetical protein [Candidatus Paceibacterota bacterium]
MNDNRLIQLLEGLKKFEPKEKTISALRGKVFSSVEHVGSARMPAPRIGSTRSAVRFLSRPIFLYPAAALLLVGVITAQGSWPINKFQAAYLETRMALASNGYEKASLSLRLAELELGNAESAGNGSARQIAYLSNVTLETNRYMSDLHLVGEPGKYSSGQCLAAYKEYDGYLDELKAAISAGLTTAGDPSLRADLSALLDQANQYQSAANVKLKLY